MSITKSITIWCDYAEPYGENRCGEWVTVPGYETVAVARQDASKDGWTFVGKLDWCPKHKDGTR